MNNPKEGGNVMKKEVCKNCFWRIGKLCMGAGKNTETRYVRDRSCLDKAIKNSMYVREKDCLDESMKKGS
jgi:hypothetical protein